MGLSMVVAGMFGSVICGVILDRTKKFKEVTLGLYLLTTLLMFVYTFVLSVKSLPLIFITTSALGELGTSSRHTFLNRAPESLSSE